ncbi:Uncharacterized protein dnm_050090 [Desulfonema magnum]|uniref:Uncharacterized protein n=1 Tax=Desulfonema magnum TaxID=45655 RepID=A0A975GQH8_9BACT|nr:Uncharacterized protein dnm_050090 [Desulfonema magnum]
MRFSYYFDLLKKILSVFSVEFRSSVLLTASDISALAPFFCVRGDGDCYGFLLKLPD